MRSGGTIVALGDSITDGFGSTPNANSRWPDLLADRLVAQHGDHLHGNDAGYQALVRSIDLALFT